MQGARPPDAAAPGAAARRGRAGGRHAEVLEGVLDTVPASVTRAARQRCTRWRPAVRGADGRRALAALIGRGVMPVLPGERDGARRATAVVLACSSTSLLAALAATVRCGARPGSVRCARRHRDGGPIVADPRHGRDAGGRRARRVAAERRRVRPEPGTGSTVPAAASGRGSSTTLTPDPTRRPARRPGDGPQPRPARPGGPPGDTAVPGRCGCCRRSPAASTCRRAWRGCGRWTAARRCRSAARARSSTRCGSTWSATTSARSTGAPPPGAARSWCAPGVPSATGSVLIVLDTGRTSAGRRRRRGHGWTQHRGGAAARRRWPRRAGDRSELVAFDRTVRARVAGAAGPRLMPAMAERWRRGAGAGGDRLGGVVAAGAGPRDAARAGGAVHDPRPGGGRGGPAARSCRR